MSDTVLRVQELQKMFHIGFFRKKVHAVRGIDFEVKRGEIFGLLGPNGAGKTTTIKMILELIFPTVGAIEVFGKPAGSNHAARQLGYMPENPYVYQYLRPLEFLDLCGRLVDLDGATRRARAEELAHTVGLGHALDRPIGKFSKGMMQRIGLAQALMHDPELLILDEPMSGLDPIGRKEIRDVLLEQRARGKTLLFTSHILSDVEMLCDRVVILRDGKIASQGKMSELLRADGRKVELVFRGVSDALREQFAQKARVQREGDGQVTVEAEGQEIADELAQLARASGAELYSLTPEKATLEALFIRDAMRKDDPS